MAITIKIDFHHPDNDTTLKAIEFITAGNTIAFPTETFYALGVSAYHEEALKKVFAIKGRNYDKPLPLLIEGKAMLKEVVSEIPTLATTLMREFWPGGLTLIFKASAKIPPLVTAHTNTVPSGTLHILSPECWLKLRNVLSLLPAPISPEKKAVHQQER